MKLVDLVHSYLEKSSAPHVVEELPLLITNWPEEWREAFKERASIMEYDGELDREEAERRAEDRVRREYDRRERGESLMDRLLEEGDWRREGGTEAL